jgi:hypothetical protein
MEEDRLVPDSGGCWPAARLTPGIPCCSFLKMLHCLQLRAGDFDARVFAGFSWPHHAQGATQSSWLNW